MRRAAPLLDAAGFCASATALKSLTTEAERTGARGGGGHATYRCQLRYEVCAPYLSQLAAAGQHECSSNRTAPCRDLAQQSLFLVDFDLWSPLSMRTHAARVRQTDRQTACERATSLLHRGGSTRRCYALKLRAWERLTRSFWRRSRCVAAVLRSLRFCRFSCCLSLSTGLVLTSARMGCCGERSSRRGASHN